MTSPLELLAEMKALCDRLEPGPWYAECIHHDGGDIAYEINQGSQLVAFYEDNFDAPANAKSYATFYAEARTAMPRLIAALEKSLEVIDRNSHPHVEQFCRERSTAAIAEITKILTGELECE